MCGQGSRKRFRFVIRERRVALWHVRYSHSLVETGGAQDFRSSGQPA
jgi:hypothetical protein